MSEILSQQRVLFGPGVRFEVSAVMKSLGCSNALILATYEQTAVAQEVFDSLGGSSIGVYAKAEMHTPIEVTRAALKYLNKNKADCLVSIGGGSTTGLGKALSFRKGLPHIVLPTTYAGSEATPILGETDNGIKTTFSDKTILPDVVLYDPELVVSLPKNMTATSGLNAMAHAIEALYARDRTDMTTEIAIAGLTDLTEALPKVLVSPSDIVAREQTLRGAWACGTVLGSVGMALHHKLCHTLGGSFSMPHAQTHAILLPHTAAFNEQAAAEQLRPAVDMFGGDLGAGLHAFAASIGAPLALSDIGFQHVDLARTADIALLNPYWNPRPITNEGILGLLKDAFSGVSPQKSEGH